MSADHPTSQGATGCSKTFFDVAHDNGADLVVEDHLYERYDRRNKTGARVANGLTSIACGTGGNSFDSLQDLPSPTPDVAITNGWGVCKLTLNTNNVQVDFSASPGSFYFAAFIGIAANFQQGGARPGDLPKVRVPKAPHFRQNQR